MRTTGLDRSAKLNSRSTPFISFYKFSSSGIWHHLE